MTSVLGATSMVDKEASPGVEFTTGPRVLGWILVFLLRCGYRVRERGYATMCC